MVSVVETVQQPRQSNQVNIDATLNILETLRLQHSNVKRFLFASSAAVYGQLEGLPKAIHSRIDPRSPYAVQNMLEKVTLKFIINCTIYLPFRYDSSMYMVLDKIHILIIQGSFQFFITNLSIKKHSRFMEMVCKRAILFILMI